MQLLKKQKYLHLQLLRIQSLVHQCPPILLGYSTYVQIRSLWHISLPTDPLHTIDSWLGSNTLHRNSTSLFLHRTVCRWTCMVGLRIRNDCQLTVWSVRVVFVVKLGHRYGRQPSLLWFPITAQRDLFLLHHNPTSTVRLNACRRSVLCVLS